MSTYFGVGLINKACNPCQQCTRRNYSGIRVPPLTCSLNESLCCLMMRKKAEMVNGCVCTKLKHGITTNDNTCCIRSLCMNNNKSRDVF